MIPLFFFTCESLEQAAPQINDYFRELSAWLKINKLSLNTSKTKYIIFKPINKQIGQKFTLNINSARIENVKEIKFLGVCFHENLSWNRHIDQLRSQIAKITGAICRIRNLLPVSTKRYLYFSLVYPRLYYCCLVWGNTTTGNYNKITLVQKKIVRVITNSRVDAHSSDLFRETGILKVAQIYTLKLGIYVHNFVNENTPDSLRRQATKYNIRNRPSYVTPLVRTNYGMQSTAFLVSDFLNRYDAFLLSFPRINAFKRAFRNYLLSNQ